MQLKASLLLFFQNIKQTQIIISDTVQGFIPVPTKSVSQKNMNIYLSYTQPIQI